MLTDLSTNALSTATKLLQLGRSCVAASYRQHYDVADQCLSTWRSYLDHDVVIDVPEVALQALHAASTYFDSLEMKAAIRDIEAVVSLRQQLVSDLDELERRLNAFDDLIDGLPEE